MLATQSSTAERLTSGRAIFQLSNNRGQLVFRVDQVEGEAPNAKSSFFVKLLGPRGFFYLGVFEPDFGWLRLTPASKLTERSPAVRAFRWLVGRVFNESEHEIDAAGFNIRWYENEESIGAE